MTGEWDWMSVVGLACCVFYAGFLLGYLYAWALVRRVLDELEGHA